MIPASGDNGCRRSKRRATLVALMIPLFAACGGPRVLPPEVKVNPLPKERYEITVTADNPPDMIQRIDGRVQFFIKNRECMPVADPIAGTKPDAVFDPAFVFERKAGNTYVGYIYADWVLPEEYYDQGICRWGITSVQALIHIGGIVQYARLSEDRMIGQEMQLNLCRRPNEGYAADLCSISNDESAANKEKKISYTVTIKSRRMLP